MGRIGRDALGRPALLFSIENYLADALKNELAVDGIQTVIERADKSSEDWLLERNY